MAQSHSSHDRCVRFSPAVAGRTCNTRYRAARYALPGRDFHPLDRASFAWRNRCYRTPKSELLHVLQRPEIPLYANGSENDIRAWVTKRKISGETMSTAGRIAREVMLGLMKTCSKLGISLFRYLSDRLHVPGAITILPLPNLIRQAAITV